MQIFLGRGPWAYVIAIAAAVVALPSASTVAHAADSSMCIFLKKVLATQAAEFSSLKGNEKPTPYKDKTTYNGKLSPERGRTCLLYVRRQVSKRVAPPEYMCTLVDKATYDQAEARYVAVSSEIKSCLTGWKYSEEKKGNRAQQSELWRLRGTGSGANIKLEVFDWSALSDRFNGTKSTKPEVSLTLYFEDTAPGPQNAQLPIVGKSAH